ncbi:MAG: hypothetical protein Q4B90_01255 [Eubacteriales bacterium]|nr:hypothetical protein [Eubacteriales bacterium]
MRLLIKQRVFSWTDTYDIYDESGKAKYFVKAELLSLGHRLHVYDTFGQEIGLIKEKIMTFLPAFEVEINGETVGRIQKKFTLLRPRYEVNFQGWTVEGDMLGWNYNVYSGEECILHISKQLLQWGDTYVLEFLNPQDEWMGLLLVLAIDAANCSDTN